MALLAPTGGHKLVKGRPCVRPVRAARDAIEGGAAGDDAAGAEDYERFVPEIEETLKAIESGTYVAKSYTPDEYLEYLRKIWEE